MCSCLRGFRGRDGCVHFTDLWRNMFQGIQLIKSMDQIVRIIIVYMYITHAIYVFKQLHSWVVAFSLRTIHLWFESGESSTVSIIADRAWDTTLQMKSISKYYTLYQQSINDSIHFETRCFEARCSGYPNSEHYLRRTGDVRIRGRCANRGSMRE